MPLKYWRYTAQSISSHNTKKDFFGEKDERICQDYFEGLFWGSFYNLESILETIFTSRKAGRHVGCKSDKRHFRSFGQNSVFGAKM